MSQLGLILRDSLRAERETRTILGLLTEQMDANNDDDRATRSRRRTLKERLRFTGMGCCGATWVFRPVRQEQRQEDGDEEATTTTTVDDEQQELPGQDPDPVELECVGPGPSGSGMNLAAALAAERQLRESQETESGGTPWRVSLMRLLEETEVETETKVNDEGGNDSVCCVCMGRKKGAAFIPCGHTFCRVCSRELWLNRGTCPLCNRSILEILDIF